MEEEWRDIDFYEGLYQVSNLGRVKSLGNDKTKKEKILKFGKNKNGYLIVVLCKNGKRKNSKVHRLVATAFIDNPSNFTMINHKDEDKTNNIVDNLEFCDAKYNLNYGTCQQRRVANIDWKAFQEKRVANTRKSVGRKNAEKLSKQVYQYSKDGNLIKIWKSTMECKRNGFHQGNVSACCRNCYLREDNNIYKGYIWSYEEL